MNAIASVPPAQKRDWKVASYWYAATAFLWAPAIVILAFYGGEALLPAVRIPKPVFLPVVFASPVLLIASVAVLATSSRTSRWLFIALNVVVLLLECILAFLAIASTSHLYH